MATDKQFSQAFTHCELRGEGEKAAYYNRLYTQHRVWMLRHVMKFGVSEVDAEEVVQEAFVRLLRLDEPSSHSYLRSYLQRIASNIAIDRYRRDRRSPEIEMPDGDPALITEVASPSPERTQAGKETLKMLYNCLKQLPPKCREAFYMYKIQGHSYAEVAAHLEVSESMVRKYVLRALRHSYSELKEFL